MVVDFAVEHDGYIAIFRQDRLITGAEVNDLEPRCPYRAHARLEHALLVGAAVNQGSCGVPNAIGIRRPTFVGETDDSTQVPAPLPISLKSACRSACGVCHSAHQGINWLHERQSYLFYDAQSKAKAGITDGP